MKTKSELLAVDPNCSVCRKELTIGRGSNAACQIGSKLYCQYCRPKGNKAAGRVDIMNDPRFAVRSFAELSIWDWHDICTRLTGYASAVMNGRAKATLQVTLSRKLVRLIVEATIEGRLVWSPEVNQNLLCWLCERVKADIDELLPSRRRRAGNRMDAAETLLDSTAEETNIVVSVHSKQSNMKSRPWQPIPVLTSAEQNQSREVDFEVMRCLGVG